MLKGYQVQVQVYRSGTGKVMDLPCTLYLYPKTFFILVSCLAMLACREKPSPPPAAAAPPPARNLVIITIDTLRADRVGAYGYTAARTPTHGPARARGGDFHPRLCHRADHADLARQPDDRAATPPAMAPGTTGCGSI